MIHDRLKVKGDVYVFLKNRAGRIVRGKHIRNLLTYRAAHWDRMMLGGSSIYGYAPTADDPMPNMRGIDVMTMADEWFNLAQIVPGEGLANAALTDTLITNIGYDVTGDIWYTIAGYVGGAFGYYGQEYMLLRGYGVDKVTYANNPGPSDMKRIFLYKHFPSRFEVPYGELDNLIDNVAITELGLCSPRREPAGSKFRRLDDAYPGVVGVDVEGFSSFVTFDFFGVPVVPPYELTCTRTPLHRVLWLQDNGTQYPYWKEDPDLGGVVPGYKASQNVIRLLNYGGGWPGASRIYTAYTTQSTYGTYATDDTWLFSRVRLPGIAKTPDESLTVIWALTVVI